MRLDLAGPLDEVVLLHRLDRGQGRSTGDGVAAVRAAEAAGVDGVHDVGATGEAGERHPPRDALGGRDEVGDDPLVVAREPVAAAAEAGLHLVGDEQDAVVAAPLRQRREEAGRRHDETALPLDRLDDDGGAVLLADLGVDLVGDVGEGLVGAVLRATRPAVRVGHRHPVQLTGERPEPVLVRHVLRGHREGEVGAAVVRVVEGDDARPTGEVPRHLHGVLDGLGPRVEQCRALVVVARGELVELLRDLDVLLVGVDHEARVREGVDLLGDGVDDPLVAVADGRHRDARAEVDELVAVGVTQDAARPLGDVDRQTGAHPGRDGGQLALLERLACRARDGGREDALLLDHGPILSAPSKGRNYGIRRIRAVRRPGASVPSASTGEVGSLDGNPSPAPQDGPPP